MSYAIINMWLVLWNNRELKRKTFHVEMKSRFSAGVIVTTAANFKMLQWVTFTAQQHMSAGLAANELR